MERSRGMRRAIDRGSKSRGKARENKEEKERGEEKRGGVVGGCAKVSFPIPRNVHQDLDAISVALLTVGPSKAGPSCQ